MKRTLLIGLSFICMLYLQAGNWNAIHSGTPKKAEINLLSSDISSSIIRFRVEGFYLNPVQTPQGEQYVVELENSSRILKAGAPDLAKLTASVIIPDEALMSSRIVSSSYVEYTGIEIAPSKGNFTRDIKPSDVPYTYGSAYQQDRFFPEQINELREPYIMRDFRGQTIIVNPFQYNPITKVLRVYTDITVEIYKIGTNGLNPMIRKTPEINIQQEFGNAYQRHFLNYSPADYTPVNDYGKMLVICHPPFMAAMQSYVNWKNAIGIPTEMVDVSTIGTTTTAIKNYIVNYYNTNTLTFVLLVGDAPQIPTNTGGGLGGPSDNAYGYIVGNDRYIDLFVGRFSAETVAEVETQVTRTLEYEKNPQFLTDDWYTTCLGIASSEGPGDDGEYDYQHVRNMQTDLLAYTYTWNPELFDGSQGGNDASGNPTPSMVATEINGGSGIVLYTGHGSNTSWSTSGFSNSNVNQLTNIGKLPFIWSVACVNGNFQSITCFAEAWLRATHNNQPTGAIAFLGSTINQSWNPPMEGQDEMVDILVETYPNNIKRTFGGLSMNGCAKMIDTYGNDGMNMADTWTLFGDPSLVVRTANPVQLTASHNPTLFVGTATFNVSCNVNGARATLSHNGNILATSLIQNGSVTLTFTPVMTPNDTVMLVINEYNYIPYIANIPVIPATGPYVIYENNLVADATVGNGNGLLDYAETTNLTIGVKNIGVASSDNTIVTLRTSSPFITITDSTENYGSIPAGEIISIAEGFQVQVASNVPDNMVIQFKILVSNGLDSWNSQFTIKAHAPVMQLGNVTVVDTAGNQNNRLDPGETVSVNIGLMNNGTSAAYNVLGVLSSVDPYILITTPSVEYGNLNPLANISKPFAVSALPNAPAGHQAVLTFTSNGDFDLSNSFDFILTIGRIPVLIIDKDGNTNSGPAMKTALNQLGVNYEYTTVFPTDLDKYHALFICLGVYPNKYILTAAEGQVLKTYLNMGGRIYMEGGDTWYYDQLNYPTPVHPMFKVKGLKDNGGALSKINGKSATFTAGMSFNYNGDNNYIDKIEPQNGSYTIFNNNLPLYDVAIANDPGTNFKTIGSAYEFGGLVDFTTPSTKKELMHEYLVFFDVFGSQYWANFVGYPNQVDVGEEVQFTDLSSTVFTQRTWTFEGGTPAVSSEPNPQVIYNVMGTYNVTLEVSSPDSTMTTTRFDYITVTDYAGVNRNTASLEVVLYPNPATEGQAVLNIRGENIDITALKIYNLLGEMVYADYNYLNNTRILLGNLRPGIYLLVVDTNQGKVTKKLIIQ
jgi:hypothetical protein